MRQFEQTELTDLVVDALRSRVRDLEYLIQHPEVTLQYSVATLLTDLGKVKNLLHRIRTEKLDVNLYPRD